MQHWSFVQCNGLEDNLLDNLHHHNLHPEEGRKMRVKNLESSFQVRKRHHPDLEDNRKSRSSSGFKSRDSSVREDNLSELLSGKNQRLDSLSYDKIKDYKPFDHRRNRVGKTNKGKSSSGPIVMDARTFRTVMTMTGGFMRRYIVGPLVRALSHQMALDEASAGPPSSNFSPSPLPSRLALQSQSKNRP